MTIIETASVPVISRASCARPSPGAGAHSSGTFLELQQLARVVAEHFDACLSQSGVTMSQFALMEAVASREPILQRDLARATGVQTSTLSRTLKPLINAGLVERARGSSHVNARNPLRLTPTGRLLFEPAEEQASGACAELERRIGAEFAARLFEVVSESLQRLSSEPVEPPQMP